MEQTIGFFRAIGLVEGTSDLFGATNQLSGDGTLAYYDPTDQRVRVRGTEQTEAVKATLAHELTHALQDQYFNLSRRGGNDDAVDRFRAVVEGAAPPPPSSTGATRRSCSRTAPPVVCEGRWRGGHFESDRIMIKHGAEYRPPPADANPEQ